MFRKALILILLLLVGLVHVPGMAMTYDLDGRTVAISTRWGSVTPLGPRFSFDWYNPDARLQSHISQVEEMFNCKIEFVNPVQERQGIPRITQEVLTGQSQFHMTSVVKDELYVLANSGLIHSLDGVLDGDYYSSLPAMFRKTDYLMVGNAVYAFEGLNYALEPLGVLWNIDMFERNGWTTPYKLYEQGEWTWESFRDIAIKATQDTNGDGNIDQHGFSKNGPLARNLQNFILTNNGSLTQLVDDSVIVSFDSPEAVEALEFLQELCSHPGVFGHRAILRSAMGIAWPTMLDHRSFREHPDNWGFITLPRGPRATDDVGPLFNLWVSVIPITEEDPRAVIEVVSALWQLTEDYMEVDLVTWEQDYWNSLRVHDSESLAFWQLAYERAAFLDHREILADAGFYDALVRIIVEGTDISVELSAIKNVAQALLDEIYQ